MASVPQSPDLTRSADDWSAYLGALELTFRLIDAGLDRTADRAAAERRARLRMERLLALLAALGNPHELVPLVHIAGTSGKGSTAAAIASGLSSAGYRTGLHTSPYLQAATENLRIDDALISGSEIAEAVDEVYRAALSESAFAEQPVSYGELWMALTLYWFAKSRADVAVLETGAGGRFDLSNVIKPALSVITTIGLDHTETLGPTISDIAWHKAGIIKSGVPVVTGVRDPESLEVIIREAMQQGSRLVLPDWNDQRDYSPNLPGSLFQSTNAALAATSLHELSRMGFSISESAIIDGVADARLPGRFETVQATPHILLDGAHNPQKMAAFAATLEKYRLPAGGSRTFVFGALEAKSYGEMLESLLPLASRFVLTRPEVYGKQGADPRLLATELTRQGFGGNVEVVEDSVEAVEVALRGTETGDEVVITGSMYLIGNVRERWYATRGIVEQQTSWPTGV